MLELIGGRFAVHVTHQRGDGLLLHGLHVAIGAQHQYEKLQHVLLQQLFVGLARVMGHHVTNRVQRLGKWIHQRTGGFGKKRRLLHLHNLLMESLGAPRITARVRYPHSPLQNNLFFVTSIRLAEKQIASLRGVKAVLQAVFGFHMRESVGHIFALGKRSNGDSFAAVYPAQFKCQ